VRATVKSLASSPVRDGNLRYGFSRETVQEMAEVKQASQIADLVDHPLAWKTLEAYYSKKGDSLYSAYPAEQRDEIKKQLDEALALKTIAWADQSAPISRSFVSEEIAPKLWLGSIPNAAKQSAVEAALRRYRVNFRSFSFIRSPLTHAHVNCGFVTFPDTESMVTARQITVILMKKVLRWDVPAPSKKEKEYTKQHPPQRKTKSEPPKST